MAEPRRAPDVAPRERAGTPRLLWLAALGGAYYLTARLSLAFVIWPENIAAVWPPSGLALAVLLLQPPRSWPASLAVIGAANFLANLQSDNPLLVCLGFALANGVESVVAATLMRAVLSPPITMTRLTEVAALIGLAAVGANAVTALLGAAVATLGLGAPFWSTWRIWLVADGLGMLMLGSVILTSAPRAPHLFPIRTRRQFVEDAALVGALIVLAGAIFDGDAEPGGFTLVLPYLTLPFLLWIAVRRGPRGAALASLVLSSTAVWQTIRRQGPFAVMGSTSEHILSAQTFLCVVVLSGLVVAAVMNERMSLEAALKESERRFRAIFDSQFQFIGLMRVDGTLIEANQTALDFAGLRREDVVGKPFWTARWWSAMGPATEQRLRDAIRAAARGEFVRYDVDVRGVSDRVATIDFSIKPVRDEQGRVILLIPEGREITEVKRATQALVEKEATLRSFFESAGWMMGIVELADGNIVHIRDNPALRAFFRLPRELQNPYSARVLGLPERVLAIWLERYRESAARGAPVRFEYGHPGPDGETWLAATVCPITPTTSAAPRFAFIVEDITARRQQERRLSASLAEKDALLKEIHHRVKNNLQVISSMLHLQFGKVTEPDARMQLLESERRVRAMALVHEQLYLAADLARIDSTTYVKRLVDMLARAYAIPGRKVTTRIDVAPESLDVDRAVPCGLLINELVSNSYKHAFPDGMSGEIRVRLGRVDRDTVVLAVADTGVGLPPGLELGTTESIGLQLVNAFAAQLGGELGCDRRGGTEIRVTFPCPAPDRTTKQEALSSTDELMASSTPGHHRGAPVRQPPCRPGQP
ncbi:MASE1 domain-containing protein [Sorangium sp. So ce269]